VKKLEGANMKKNKEPKFKARTKIHAKRKRSEQNLNTKRGRPQGTNPLNRENPDGGFGNHISTGWIPKFGEANTEERFWETKKLRKPSSSTTRLILNDTNSKGNLSGESEEDSPGNDNHP